MPGSVTQSGGTEYPQFPDQNEPEDMVGTPDGNLTGKYWILEQNLIYRRLQ